MLKEVKKMTEEEERVYEWVMGRPQRNACAVYGICYHVAERIKNGEHELIPYAMRKALESNEFFKVEKDIQVVANICKLFEYALKD